MGNCRKSNPPPVETTVPVERAIDNLIGLVPLWPTTGLALGVAACRRHELQQTHRECRPSGFVRTWHHSTRRTLPEIHRRRPATLESCPKTLARATNPPRPASGF